MAKRLLITGAFGQLGEAVVQELQPHFELLATGHRIPGDYLQVCPVECLNIAERKNVIRLVRSFHPHIVLNLAAFTNVDKCEELRERAWKVNVKGVEYLLEAIKGMPTKIIHISTDYIFDGEGGPYDEHAVPNPINYYGKSKLASENAVRGCSNPWMIVRTHVLYGASEHTKANFVNWVVRSLRKGKEICVVGDQWGNPTWTGGMAEALKMAVILNVRGIFNYGGAEFLTRYEFAKKIAEVFGLESALITPLTTEELGQKALRPLRSGLVTDKIEEILGLRTYGVEYCLRKVKEGVIV